MVNIFVRTVEDGLHTRSICGTESIHECSKRFSISKTIQMAAIVPNMYRKVVHESEIFGRQNVDTWLYSTSLQLQ